MTEVATLKLRIDSREAKTAAGDLDRLGRSAKVAETASNSASRSFSLLGRAAGAVSASLVARQVIEAADAYKNLNARLQLATRNSTDFARAQQSLLDIAQRTRVGLGPTADLYTSLSRSTEQLGVSQSDLFKVTEAINQSLIISGTSAQAAQAALVQLGQGFASGTLRGEELNSVLEQAPRLAQAVAEGLGVTRGQLRELGKDGELTSQKVFNAILQSTKKLDSEFQKLPLTVSQATTQVGTSLSVLIGQIDKATGATSGLAGVLSGISTALDSFSADELTKARIEVERLQTKRVALNLGGANDLRIGQIDRQITAAEGRLKRLQSRFSPDNETSAEGRRLGLLPPTPIPPADKPDKPPRSVGVRSAPVNEAQQYLDNLRSQLEATEQLSTEQTLLRDLELGRLGLVTAAQRTSLVETAKKIDLDRELSDITEQFAKIEADAIANTNRLQEEARAIFEATRSPIEALAAETYRLNKFLASGAINWDTYTRAIFAAQDQFDSINAKAKGTADELDKFGERAAKNIQDALGQELTSILEGNFDNIGDSFTKVINRMVAEAVAADLAKALGLGGGSGGGGGGGGGGGFFGDLVKTGISFFTGAPGRAIGGPVSAGGLYEVNERAPEMLSMGGRDFLMMGAQGGNVTPNGGGGGRQLVVNQTINVMPGATRQTGMQAAAEASRKLQAAARNL